MEQQVYAMQIAARPGMDSSVLAAELSPMIARAANLGFPQGIFFQDCQVVVNEEPLMGEDGNELWRGSLLINTLVDLDPEIYQEWYWMEGRDVRTQSLNDHLRQGQGSVLWVQVQAV